MISEQDCGRPFWPTFFVFCIRRGIFVEYDTESGHQAMLEGDLEYSEDIEQAETAALLRG